MKKLFVFVSAVIAMVSCQVVVLTDVETNAEENTVIFKVETTKISLGEKVEGSYPLLWQSGDALDVYSSDFAEKLGTAALVSGAGEANATFSFTGEISDGQEVALVYPSSENGLIIPKEQSADGFYACASATVEDGEASFVLQHASYVRFVLGSTAMADWSVKEILFDSYKMPLSGEYVFSENAIAPKDEVTVTGTTDGGFTLKLNTPALLSSNPEFIGAVIPCNLSSKDVFVTLKLVKDGQETVISKKISGKELAQNHISTIKWMNIDHVYAEDLDTPVVFRCYGTTSDLETFCPLWALRRAGENSNTFGTGNGIFLNTDYGTRSTAYGDVQLGDIHLATENYMLYGNGSLTYAYATDTDGHFAFAPACQNDAFVLHIPVKHVDAGKTLVFATGVMGSNDNSPNTWVAEYSLDGSLWTAFETAPTISISSTNKGKGCYTIAKQVLASDIDNSILCVRLRADGTGTVSGKTTGNATTRFIFHKNYKASLGGPAVWTE